jgi:hypothetical protein
MEQTNRDILGNGENLSQILGRQAKKNEEIARQLSREAIGQWEKALGGFLALPAAMALSTAANTLLVAAFIERGFEAFQVSAEALGREVEQQVRGHAKVNGG